jgi:hypothetical protein
VRCHPKSDRRLAITSSNRGIPVEHASALPAARSRCLVWPVLPAGSRRWGSRKSLRRRVLPGRGSLRYNAPAWIRQEPSGNMSGKRLAAFAGTAGHGYTYGRTLTTSSKGGSCLRSTICTLACMAAAAVRTKCRRASTVTRTRARGASNNFGNGFGSGYLAGRKAPFLRAGGSTQKV